MRLLVVPLLCLLLPGCALLHPGGRDDQSAPRKIVAIRAPAGADPYLALLYDFSQANADGRRVIYHQVATDVALNPSRKNKLRLALLEGWPDHATSNRKHAIDILKNLLDDPAALDMGARDLARVYLAMLDDAADRANENAGLRQQLADAHKKLDALTAIEQTVDKSDAPSQSKPEKDNAQQRPPRR